MSDKNIELIKAIQSTGKCPIDSSVKVTNILTEGKQLPSNPSSPKTTRIIFNSEDEGTNN